MDLGEMLAGEGDLSSIERAVVRERAIRNGMARTGEGRQVVTEMLDAMKSMDEEAVLDLTEGEPTTMADALARYVDVRASQEEPSHEVGAILADLSAILEYPWPESA